MQVEPRTFNQGHRKNDAFTHSATLNLQLVVEYLIRNLPIGPVLLVFETSLSDAELQLGKIVTIEEVSTCIIAN